jgi:TolA-binding protein
MRFHLVTALLLGTAAASASAQQQAPVVQPEIRTGGAPVGYSGVPASSAIADLTARMDAMESQLARLTGQVEEANYRVRQLETEIAALRAAPPAPTAQPQQQDDPETTEPEPKTDAPRPRQPAAEEPIATGDPGEDAYLAGFRLWEAKQYADAQKALEAAAKKYPKHRRASYALNLAGRAYLDEGKPATAAKVLLSSYQAHPKGERAADSLYFLGQALMELKKPAEACKVYDELQTAYPDMRDWLKQRLPEARKTAKCTS